MSARRTDDTYTHTLVLEDGTSLCFRADHGANYVDVLRPGARAWSTNRVAAGIFANSGRRLGEIAAVTDSTRGRA